MKGILAALTSIAVVGLSSMAFADDQMMWKGEFYSVMPNKEGITEDYCKAHVLDTYKTNANMMDKEVKADNGVTAKNVTNKMKESGGVYFINGTAMFMGTTDNKEWKDKVYFFAHALQKDGMQQGIWYTKDCKGFYKVGPA